MEHSKTPWRVSDKSKRVVCYGHDEVVINSEANARRIVACVNACRDIETEVLEMETGSTALFGRIAGKLTSENMRLRDSVSDVTAQRDELQSQLATERASLFAENQRKQQLEQQVDELVQALEFYADKQRYMGSNQRVEAPDIYGESPSNTVYLWDVIKDGGDIARAVIQKVRGGEC